MDFSSAVRPLLPTTSSSILMIKFALSFSGASIPDGEGIYTDMNAIRPCETLDNIHFVYVDQWDWERVISNEDRNEKFLTDIVKKIYNVFKRTDEFLSRRFMLLTVYAATTAKVHLMCRLDATNLLTFHNKKWKVSFKNLTELN